MVEGDWFLSSPRLVFSTGRQVLVLRESLGVFKAIWADDYTTRHCMILVSFPPVEIKWLSSCKKLTLVT